MESVAGTIWSDPSEMKTAALCSSHSGSHSESRLFGNGLHIYIYVDVYIWVIICTHIYVIENLYICISFYVRVNICVCTRICTFANIRVHIYPHKDGEIVHWPAMTRLFAHNLVLAGSLWDCVDVSGWK